ncbi:MAG: hypothetical protein ACR2NX_05960 [Chthoniobacterales bacterium]
MRQLASYVTVAANGDLAVLVSSGFPIQKPTREKIGDLPTPEAPKTNHGELTGQVIAKTRAIYGAGVYNWRVALASSPTTYVIEVQTTSSRAVFEGLVAGQLYNIEVSATGAAGPSNFSVIGQVRSM